jgi:hypothetical protein
MQAKTLKYLLAIVVVALVVVSALSFFAPSTIPAWQEQRQAAQDGVEKTYDWNNAVEDYEWFKEQRNDIEVKRKEIENVQQEKRDFLETYGNDTSEWQRTTRVQYNRINQRITGLRNLHDEYVGEYNARAEQAHRSIFRCGLPYEMDKKFWIGDGRPDDKYEEQAQDNVPDEAEDCEPMSQEFSESP